jgi:hypothetical protein
MNEGIVRYVPVLYTLLVMTSYPPETPGAIQARLAYLRLRKTALDELILSLERYSNYELPTSRKIRSEPQRQVRTDRMAGAA